VNPASVIPVAAGDFANTNKGLAPIANQFLNSPHAKYVGSSTKVDIGDKTKYTSTFEGYVCRTPATQFRNNAAPGDSQANCQAAGLTWYTPAGFTAFLLLLRDELRGALHRIVADVVRWNHLPLGRRGGRTERPVRRHRHRQHHHDRLSQRRSREDPQPRQHREHDVHGQRRRLCDIRGCGFLGERRRDLAGHPGRHGARELHDVP
jgi:hypothetical protein